MSSFQHLVRDSTCSSKSHQTLPVFSAFGVSRTLPGIPRNAERRVVWTRRPYLPMAFMGRMVQRPAETRDIRRLTEPSHWKCKSVSLSNDNRRSGVATHWVPRNSRRIKRNRSKTITSYYQQERELEKAGRKGRIGPGPSPATTTQWRLLMISQYHHFKPSINY